MSPKRVCRCKKKTKSQPRNLPSAIQTFDRVEWLKKRVPSEKLIDRTVKLKYLIHPNEINEHTAIKKVFNGFDEDGNSITLFSESGGGNQKILVELLEAEEVMRSFDHHNLKVKEESIVKLFKSVALNRKRLDPCNVLTFYEFCIFSKKASGDFQKLMNNIKSNMLQMLTRKGTSTIDLGNRSGVKQLLPPRKATYIKYLPSSFNPLMNHFKDEEKRNELRTNLIQNLKEILREKDPTEADSEKAKAKKKLSPENEPPKKKAEKIRPVEQILEHNAETMKGLIKSHFPEEETDEESRRLFTQTKRAAEGFEKLKQKVKGIYALHRQSTMDLNTMLPLLSEKDPPSVGPDPVAVIRAKTRKETRRLIQNAKQQGKIEAYRFLKHHGNTVDNRALTALTAENTARSKSITSGKKPFVHSMPNLKASPLATQRPLKTELHAKKLLQENLVLHTQRCDTSKVPLLGTTIGECLSTTETLGGGPKDHSIPEGNMSKTISAFEGGISKNFHFREALRQPVRVRPVIHPRTFSAAGTYDYGETGGL